MKKKYLSLECSACQGHGVYFINEDEQEETCPLCEGVGNINIEWPMPRELHPVTKYILVKEVRKSLDENEDPLPILTKIVGPETAADILIVEEEFCEETDLSVGDIRYLRQVEGIILLVRFAEKARSAPWLKPLRDLLALAEALVTNKTEALELLRDILEVNDEEPEGKSLAYAVNLEKLEKILVPNCATETLINRTRQLYAQTYPEEVI